MSLYIWHYKLLVQQVEAVELKLTHTINQQPYLPPQPPPQSFPTSLLQTQPKQTHGHCRRRLHFPQLLAAAVPRLAASLAALHRLPPRGWGCGENIQLPIISRTQRQHQWSWSWEKLHNISWWRRSRSRENGLVVGGFEWWSVFKKPWESGGGGFRHLLT